MEEVFEDHDDAMHYAAELERIEAQNKSDVGDDSKENNCKRFSKILKSILGFISNQKGKVLLVLSNRNVGNGTHKIDTYKHFCEEAGKDISNLVPESVQKRYKKR